ncbi:hypothetical protein K2173_003738 [Erythroxylum novogranatense]|uniref:C2 domain-containing protein n=1 Tax=Erythroxylum novogranatense TaxID=1862640 RepID=A0AAV8TAY4_9ROSI|nr:hypothetical protein K2173_003738 [Erythroxylum novogranatense]
MSNVRVSPFQLLELNVISAQDLAQVSRKMRTYAVAWVHPDRKLSTRVDTDGHCNPTWNDKFVFRVDDQFLHGDTSAVMIEIYAVHWFRDVHIGTVRVIVGNLIPPPTNNHDHHRQVQLGMRFVALQVRRRSGRPQGILNIGVALLDSTRRSLPLFSHINASAVGYSYLMGEKDSRTHQHKDHNEGSDNSNSFPFSWPPKPELRRTKSESSSMVGSSVVTSRKKIHKGEGSSVIDDSIEEKKKIHKGKASSVIDDSTVERKKNRRGRSKASSTVSSSDVVKKDINKSPFNGFDITETSKAKFNPNPKFVDSSSDSTANNKKFNVPNGTLKRMNYPVGPLVITDSELGPSASEVAAAVAKRRPYAEDSESEVMWEWNMDGAESLRSKLERWRAEAPPVYDRGSVLSDFTTGSGKPSGHSGGKSSRDRNHRHSTDGNGLFSCFGSICGIECSIVCGASNDQKGKGRRVSRSPSSSILSFL